MAEYPPYSLKIEGLAVDRKMTGTHSGSLVTSNPEVIIKFELTNGDADPPIEGQKPPNLILKLTQVAGDGE